MKKRLVIFLLFFSLVLFFPNQVRAQTGACSAGMIDSIEFELKIKGGGSPQTVTLTESGPLQAIYKDSSNYYLDEQKTQQITDIANVKINHSPSFLNQVALNKKFALEKTILFYGPGACENESRSLDDIKNKSGSWDFNYTSSINDMECVFDNPITLELRDPLKTGDNLICSKSYQYSAGEVDSDNTCKISMTPSNGATIEDEVIIQGEDIDDEGVGIRTYLNGEDISPFFMKSEDLIGKSSPSLNQGTIILSKNSNGLFNLTFPLTTLSAGDYLFEIKYEDGDKADQNICALRFPVVPAGASPTPGQQLDASSSSRLLLDIATTIPLCESIPIGTMCGERSCQDICFECKKSEVWTGIGCLPTNFSGLVNSIFTTFSGILGGLIFICIMSNGIKIMISRGNPEALKKSQEGLTACIVGFLVLTLSVLFLKIVGVDILHIFDISGN